MTWDESMFEVFEDLEQQASGLRLAERDAEVAEMTVAEYAHVGLMARLHASRGRELRLRLLGGLQVAGRVQRCGGDWVLVADGAVEWIVPAASVASLTGASVRADSPETWSVVDRLSLRSVLRRLAVERAPCVVHLVDRSTLTGLVRRVGHDFLELEAGAGEERPMHLVPVSAVAALQERL